MAGMRYQPQGQLRLNKEHPLAPGIVDIWVPGVNSRGVVSGIDSSNIPVAYVKPTSSGLGFNPGTNGRRYSSTILNGQQVAWLVVAHRSNTNVNCSIIRKDGTITPMQEWDGLVRTALFNTSGGFVGSANYGPTGNYAGRVSTFCGVISASERFIFSNGGDNQPANPGSGIVGNGGSPFCIGAAEINAEVATNWTILFTVLWQGPSVPTTTQLRSLSANPWQLLSDSSPEEDFDILTAPVVLGSYTLPANSGGFASTYPPSGVRKASILSAASSSAVLLNGLATRLLNNKRVYAQTSTPIGVASSTTRLVSARRVIAQASTQFTFSASSTRVLSNRLVSAQTSSPMAVNYGSVKLLNNRLVYAQTSTVPFSGNTNRLLNNKLVKAAVGSSTLSGASSRLLNNKLVYAQTSPVPLSGNTNKLLNNKLVKAQVGSSSLSGASSRILCNRVVSLSSGVLPLVVNPASLLLSVRGLFSVSSGTFSVSPSNTSLRIKRGLTVNSVSYSLTNVNNKLLMGRKLRSDSQVYTMSGQSIFTRMFRRFSAAVDNYALSGTASRLKLFLRLGVVGRSISDAYGSVISRVSRKLPASGRNLEYSGSETSFTYTSLGTNISTGFRNPFRNMFRSL